MEITTEQFRKVFREYIITRNNREWDSQKYKLGRLLTIVDGAIADPEQRKAIKDMVHDVWHGDQLPSGMPSEENLMFIAITGEDLYKDDTLSKSAEYEPVNPYLQHIK